MRAALQKLIERAGEVEVNAAAVVSAVSAYARINAAGQWVERSEHVDLNQLFERMTTSELEEYARDGKLPDWFIELTHQGGTSFVMAKHLGMDRGFISDLENGKKETCIRNLEVLASALGLTIVQLFTRL